MIIDDIVREKRLNKIMNCLNKLIEKDTRGEEITTEDLKDYKQLEKDLLIIGYEHLGNGLIIDKWGE